MLGGMTEQDLLKIIRDAGPALVAWENVKNRDQSSVVDSNTIIMRNNQEEVRIFGQAGKMRQMLLDAVIQFTRERLKER